MTALIRLLCAAALAVMLALPATSLAGGDNPPSASAVQISAVGEDTARVEAVVTLGSGSAGYWFEYGTSPALGRSTSPGTADHEHDDKEHRVAVSRTLTALAPGTRHYVRLVAVGQDGRSSGPIASFTTTPAPTNPATDAPQQPGATAPAGAEQPSAPVLGSSVVVAGAGGVVRIKPRGSDEFAPLGAAASIRVGSVVDARRGSVAVSAARDAAGRTQQGTFGGGRFLIRQSRDGRGYLNLHLRGGGLSGCAERAVASAAATRGKRARRLWGADRGGRFRTHGRDSVATVRGTRWTMIDRCDGTVTKVAEGAVDVKVRRTGRVVRVSAGERHLARHRR